MHYNELQFLPTEKPGNFYSLCVVEPGCVGTEPLGNTDRAVCLVAIAGGSVYALRFTDLDCGRPRSPLVVSKYALIDLNTIPGKRKLFSELTNEEIAPISVEICAIDSLQANGRTYIGFTFSKTVKMPQVNESTTYGFALFELVKSAETKTTTKLDLVCLFKRPIDYMPSLLTHTKIYRLHECKLEDVFVSFCFEKSRHDKGCMFGVISLNQHEKEDLELQYFPEMVECGNQLKNVFQGQFLLTNADTVRLSAWGTDTGFLRVSAVDLRSLDVLKTCALEYDVSIVNCRFLAPPPRQRPLEWDDPALGLLVAAVTEPIVVFTNLFDQPTPAEFDDTRELDCPAFVCALDVDEDGVEEVVVGSFCQRVRLYKRGGNASTQLQLQHQPEYRAIFERLFNSPVQCVAHADVTGDGVRELLVLTLNGLHVLQRSRGDIEAKLLARLAELQDSGDGDGGGDDAREEEEEEEVQVAESAVDASAALS